MPERVVVVGSGAGGSVAAMVLAEAGYDVVVLERGPNFFSDDDRLADMRRFGIDELKGPHRRFDFPDDEAEPRVFEHRAIEGHRVVGEINALPIAVGGGTVHWDAKTPRMWDIDFQKRSALGPLPDADVVDWPLTYDELVPHYEAMEHLLGVQGDVAAMPESPTLRHAPRRRPFPLRPGPAQRSSALAAEGAASLGLQPFPMPMAVNSEPYGGRPACVNCGYCDSHGCPTEARGSALVPLRRALRAGAELRTGCHVTEVEHSGGKARAVRYRDARGTSAVETADIVVLAASCVETARIALMSDFPDRSGMIGRGLMFHNCVAAYGLLPGTSVNTLVGRGHTHAMDEFADPDFGAARAAARQAGLGYVRGGVVAMGIAPIGPITEGQVYRRLLSSTSPERPFGVEFKRLMRSGLLRRSMLGLQMHAEDVAQRENRIALDAHVRDWQGLPVPRIEYAPHRHERVAQEYFGERMRDILRAAGATAVTSTPEMRGYAGGDGGPVPTNSHTLGGMRMGGSPDDSVLDEWGRMWELDNLLVADGSVFPTSGGHNPTLTIMALALRNARNLAGVRDSAHEVALAPGES